MRWSREVDGQLRDTDFGILCLTKENQTASWLLFEAGALAKSVKGAAVCPYLIDLTPSELLDGPLTAFQAKRANREETFDMIVAVNSALPDGERLAEVQLRKAFARWWPDLESVLAALPSPAEPVRDRTPTDVADELLSSTRQLGRQMAEALAILSHGATQRVPARNVQHVRISGQPAQIDELLDELHGGDFGGRTLQRQRYSDTVAAVNVGTDPLDDPFDTEKLFKRAGDLGLMIKVNLISS
jgi:hypothetical protein